MRSSSIRYGKPRQFLDLDESPWRVEGGTVAGEDVVAEVCGGVPPDGVNVVDVSLRVVVFGEQARSLQPVVVRLSALGAHRPKYVAAAGAGWEALMLFGQTTIRDKVVYGTGAFLINRPYVQLCDEMRALPITSDVLEAWL